MNVCSVRASLLVLALAAAAPTSLPATANDADEAVLVRESDVGEQMLRDKGFVVEEPDLVAYVGRVGARIVARIPTPRHSYRFRIARDPLPNATAFANGAIFVHLGLLSALANEAELANVLAHEIVHAERRHHLASYRDTRSKVLTAKITDLLSGGIATPLVVPTLAARAAGFSREQEAEADREGLLLAWSAGYRADAAIRSFTSIEESVPPLPAHVDRSVLGHPDLATRASALRSLLSSFDPPASVGEVGEAAHAGPSRKAARSSITLAIEQRLYRHARREIDRRLRRGGDDAWLTYASGELHRALADDPDGAAWDEARETAASSVDPLTPGYRAKIAEERRAATAAYDHALALDPSLAEAHRGRGLLARAAGDHATAARELPLYLANRATAPDRRTIERILKEVSP